MSPRAAGETRAAGSPRGTAAARTTRPKAVAGREPTVSSVSAARFAARVRARRRRRALLIAAAVLLVGGLVGGALDSPWTTVREIRVSGTARIPASTVRDLLADQRGRPLPLVDTSALAARVRTLGLVAAVQVRRSWWPASLEVTVRERQAVAAVPAVSGVRLVDVDGVEVATAERAPAGLPLVQVNLARARPGSLAAVLQVLSGLPAALSPQVGAIGAASPDSVWLTLLDGARVQWGSAADTPGKAKVLARLRVAAELAGTRARGSRYDVSAPGAPAVSAAPAVG
jgi:cell division protein FtsQ